ncbi:PREDICTED: B3 domain-containing [Prunus dulcis]|uniref:PREDICTED: B3 domain-containing n=1 Tax=Prunus dulcis TaxID=3755 RepID=A0A5E4EYK2_PRUDU|nr:hypothetical protein L3X38_008721 [Prunus dulcis]VVA20240.1 PREDICTED: B3 domain-containing [Prunus dulcis]
MPQDLKTMISRSGGGDLKLVIEKELFDTDVADNSQQFSIPMKQVKEDFLSEKDQTELKLRSGHNERVQLWSMSRKSQLRFALVKGLVENSLFRQLRFIFSESYKCEASENCYEEAF